MNATKLREEERAHLADIKSRTQNENPSLDRMRLAWESFPQQRKQRRRARDSRLCARRVHCLHPLR